MDPVDREFVRAIFPEYLLKQPIANQLWASYYKHKKLFVKFQHSNLSNSDTNGFERFEDRPFIRKLPPSTKKEIWHRLMDIGVLGTISFDNVQDDYLVQVYKYFFPDNLEEIEQGNDNLMISSRKASLYETIKQDNLNNSPIQQHNTTVPETSEGQQDADVEIYDNEGEGEEIEDDEDSNDDEVPDTASFAHDIERDSDNDVLRPDREARPKVDENLRFYDTTPQSEVDSRRTMKENKITHEVYSVINYPLPYQWVKHQSNSITLSADGVSQLSCNPNWQSYIMARERSNGIGRNGIRGNLSGSTQKYDYSATWANRVIPSDELAIYYYEIRVLKVTSSQGAQNSNIMVGFKEINGEKLEPRNESNQDSTSRQESTSMGLSVNTLLNISSSQGLDAALLTETGPTGIPGPGSEGLTGIGTGKNSIGHFIAYCGFNGSLTSTAGNEKFSNPFGRDDIIGCGINFINGSIFFTKNGLHLGETSIGHSNSEHIPYIALKPGNSVRTNFGLHEEFNFDITGYVNRWKKAAYTNIYGSIDDTNSMNNLNFESFVSRDNDNSNILFEDDGRFVDGKMFKPSIDRINTLKGGDGSFPCTLNILINDYLMHEGLIDVAKGFLNDLRKDCIVCDDGDATPQEKVISYNERQIIKEERMLKTRQELKKLIRKGQLPECVKFLNKEVPGLLEVDIELLFELRLAEYLLAILNMKNNLNLEEEILRVITLGQELNLQFVDDEAIDSSLRDKFRTDLNSAGSLLAYDDPVLEAQPDKAKILTPNFLQERLFQICNMAILKFLHKDSDCGLEMLIKYTRSMGIAMMHSKVEGVDDGEGRKLKYYKIVNIDEDLLQIPD